MSTQQTAPTPQENPFASSVVGADPKPTLICVGDVTEITPPKAFQSDFDRVNTHVIEFHLKPVQSGTKGKISWRFNPAFFEKGFSPSGKAAKETYGDSYEDLQKSWAKNIYGNSEFGISIFQAICGSEEAVAEITNRIRAFDEITEITIYQVLLEALAKKEIGQNVGYILQQQVKAAGVKEDGKTEFIPTQYYGVRSNWNGFKAGVFYPTEKNEKTLLGIAQRSVASAEKAGNVGFLAHMTFGAAVQPF